MADKELRQTLDIIQTTIVDRSTHPSTIDYNVTTELLKRKYIRTVLKEGCSWRGTLKFWKEDRTWAITDKGKAFLNSSRI